MAHKNLLIFLSTYSISKGSFGHSFTDIVTFLAPDILLNMYTITRLLIHGFFFQTGGYRTAVNITTQMILFVN